MTDLPMNLGFTPPDPEFDYSGGTLDEIVAT